MCSPLMNKLPILILLAVKLPVPIWELVAFNTILAIFSGKPVTQHFAKYFLFLNVATKLNQIGVCSKMFFQAAHRKTPGNVESG